MIASWLRIISVGARTEEVVSRSQWVLTCVCLVAAATGEGDGRNLSCWLLEFQEGVSHFLWANLADVYCCCGDEQLAPTQQLAVLTTPTKPRPASGSETTLFCIDTIPIILHYTRCPTKVRHQQIIRANTNNQNDR